MLIIVGLVVLLAAVMVGIAGVAMNAGATHLLSHDFSLLGYDIVGSTGTVFLSGIVVGAVAAVGLCVMLVGARRAVNRSHASRRGLATSETAADNAVHPNPGARPAHHQQPGGRRGRWASLTDRLARWLIGEDEPGQALRRRSPATAQRRTGRSRH